MVLVLLMIYYLYFFLILSKILIRILSPTEKTHEEAQGYC